METRTDFNALAETPLVLTIPLATNQAQRITYLYDALKEHGLSADEIEVDQKEEGRHLILTVRRAQKKKAPSCERA